MGPNLAIRIGDLLFADLFREFYIQFLDSFFHVLQGFQFFKSWFVQNLVQPSVC